MNPPVYTILEANALLVAVAAVHIADPAQLPKHPVNPQKTIRWLSFEIFL
jgi:hypothetical protein